MKYLPLNDKQNPFYNDYFLKNQNRYLYPYPDDFFGMKNTILRYDLSDKNRLLPPVLDSSLQLKYNEKGEIIEQNIDRILNQNKTLYLENLINQKKKKENQLQKSPNNKNKNLILKYYFSKWKDGDNSNLNGSNNNNDQKDDENMPYNKLNDMFRKLLLKRPFDIMKQNYYLHNNNKNNDSDDLDEIPDLNYIRNKLHVSIVKRIKITEDEINKYKDFINIISSGIKKNIYKHLMNQIEDEENNE